MKSGAINGFKKKILPLELLLKKDKEPYMALFFG